MESFKFCNFFLFLIEIIQGRFDIKTKFIGRMLLEMWKKDFTI